MPGYPWFETTAIPTDDIEQRMKVLRTLGAPYSDQEINAAPQQLAGKTEMDAMIAYLQVLGTSVKTRR